MKYAEKKQLALLGRNWTKIQTVVIKRYLKLSGVELTEKQIADQAEFLL